VKKDLVLGMDTSNYTCSAALAHGAETILFTGGVAASSCLRRRLAAAESGPGPVFGAAALCGDNAVGIALLGTEKLWP
jgi:tRNA A37 threonylcarbamoyltransferase TsaD